LRPPDDEDIYAPEFPKGLDWVNVAFLRMDRQMGRHAVLVEFWDFARINSDLRVVLVQSPGYSFGTDPAVARAAIERLGIGLPVALDVHHAVWRAYGNRGWPGRYLFDRRGVLTYFHYGEGDYDGTERAIQAAVAEIDPDFEPPAPLEPLRPEDAPGALMEAQTADIVLPADRSRVELVRDWVDGPDYIEAADAGASALFRFDAGGAWAVLSGADLEPGLYETEGTVEAESPGVRLHGVQFTPRPPSPS
jgi:hypothetical protein